MSVRWRNGEKLKFDRTEDPVFRMHEYHVDVQGHHVYLMPWDELAATGTYEDAEPGVEWTMANKFIMNVHLCMRSGVNTKAEGNTLVIHMKTCGGEWGEGMAIFDTLISYPAQTTILNYTHARSMSSLIFCAGGKRVMMPHSHFMFHDGTYADAGTVKQVRANWDLYEKMSPVMLEIYARRMKQKGKWKRTSLDGIHNMLREQMDKKEDVYLSARETIEWGLADEMFNGDWKALGKVSAEQERNAHEFAEYFLTYDAYTVPDRTQTDS